MIVLTTKELMIADDFRNNLLLKRKTEGICLAKLNCGMIAVCFIPWQLQGWFDSHKTKINFIPLDEAVYTLRHLQTDTSNRTVSNFCLRVESWDKDVKCNNFFWQMRFLTPDSWPCPRPKVEGRRTGNNEPAEMQRHLNLCINLQQEQYHITTLLVFKIKLCFYIKRSNDSLCLF